MKKIILFIALLCLPLVTALNNYQNICWPLTNGISCINGSTGANILAGVSLDWSNILNAPAGAIGGPIGTNCTAGQAFTSYDNYTGYFGCQAFAASGGSGTLNATDGSYIINLQGNVTFNQSLNNLTIRKLAPGNSTNDIEVVANASINAKLLGKEFFFYANSTVSGTATGELKSTQQSNTYDSISFNLTEAVPNGLEYYTNTSANVTSDINKICIRYKAIGDSYLVQLFSSSTGQWESGYLELGETSEWKYPCADIRDPSDHLVGNKILIKITHIGTAATAHKLVIDAMYISSGYTPTIGNEVDPIWTMAKPHYMNATETNTTITRLEKVNSTADIQAVPVGGDVTGTVGTISINDTVDKREKVNSTADVRAALSVADGNLTYSSATGIFGLVYANIQAWLSTIFYTGAQINDTIAKLDKVNTTADVQAVPVGGDATGTVLNIYINNTVDKRELVNSTADIQAVPVGGDVTGTILNVYINTTVDRREKVNSTADMQAVPVGGTETSGTVGTIVVDAALTRDTELDNTTIVRGKITASDTNITNTVMYLSGATARIVIH